MIAPAENETIHALRHGPLPSISSSSAGAENSHARRGIRQVGTENPSLSIPDASLLEMDARTAPRKLKFAAAIGYGLMSITIMMLSKLILTEFDFRCFIFVGFLQYLATAVVTYARARMNGIRFPLRDAFRVLFVDLFPLPMVFLFNTLSGLGATQSLNMPLFVLMRRLSIVMTLVGEATYLRYRHHWEVYCAVGLMIFGALVASQFDAAIPFSGVVFVLVNDVCTAMNGVLTRWKLDKKTMSSEAIMFYINVFAACCSGFLILCGAREELFQIVDFAGWSFSFVVLLSLNALSGFGINYLLYLCMKLNSPLTVSMIGAGKNVITSYAGMIFRDYSFTSSSFIGINLSVLGCALYSHREIVRILGRQDAEERQKSLAKKEDPHEVC